MLKHELDDSSKTDRVRERVSREREREVDRGREREAERGKKKEKGRERVEGKRER